MGPAQADRALDDSNLAVRVNHRSSRLPNALPMVSATCSLSAVASAVPSGLPGQRNFRCAEDSARYSYKGRKFLRCQNLALHGDLMFDQDDVLQRVKEILW